MKIKQILSVIVVIALAALTASSAHAQANNASQGRRGRFGGPERGVYKARIVPHWFAADTKFWYRNDLRGGAREFILVDCASGVRARAFDHDAVAKQLGVAEGGHLPVDELQFSDDGQSVLLVNSTNTWRLDLKSGQVDTNQVAAAKPGDKTESQSRSTARENGGGDDEERPSTRSPHSPDGKWTAFIKDQNVFMRPADGGAEVQLSKDGQEGEGYSMLRWSPDSQSIVAWHVTPGDRKEVYLVESSPSDAGRAVLHKRPYAQAGDKFTTYQVNVFDVADRKQIKPDIEQFEHEWERPQLHWSRDQRHFYYSQEDRGHQRFRVIEVDCRTGATRNLVDEKTKTFIWTAHTEMLGVNLVNWLTNSDEMVYVSERDGWRHLYLVDAKEGGIKNQITKGPWVVRGLDRIDEEARQIWFRAGGMNAGQDPYFLQYYRVNFDGTGLTALTEGDGNHTVQYSGDRKYLIDTYSRVDMAPVHNLRKTSDGSLVCELEQTDISELKEKGWKPPEVFVAKGRDGETDIWGIICRPKNFDPDKKYPVLEDIYSGPQGAYVPKSFSAAPRFASYTDLGFIVVQMDAMGTAFRSKAFHDVCWHNLADAGFPDRILWHRAAGAKYPSYDLTRVGIFGTSAGGQNAAAAVIFHPDFYKAAVANSGCHDNRLDKASWNEQWMGYMPPDKLWSKDDDNWYSKCSNIDNAGKLGAKLFLIVGEMDDNVPPESTMRLVDALIKARKDFDFLEVPGANHGAGSPVTQRRTQDFFVQNLLGKLPPNRNAGESAVNTSN